MMAEDSAAGRRSHRTPLPGGGKLRPEGWERAGQARSTRSNMGEVSLKASLSHM